MCAGSDQEICLKVETNEIWAERTDQKHINNLPLVWQFALTDFKFHVVCLGTCLDATDKFCKYLVSFTRVPQVLQIWLILMIIYSRVNCYDAGAPQAPFGGFKMSGHGREW